MSFVWKATILLGSALCASLILRMQLGWQFWPSPQDMGLDIRIGVINALALFAAAFSVANLQSSVLSGDQSSRRTWVYLAVFCGGVSIVCTAREYLNRWQENVIPVPYGLYGQADTAYLSAVTQRLVFLNEQAFAEDARQSALADRASSVEQGVEAEGSPGSNSAAAFSAVEANELAVLQAGEALRRERVALTTQLLRSAAIWTGELVGKGVDLDQARSALRTLADDIHPSSFYRDDASAYRRLERGLLRDQIIALQQEQLSLEQAEATVAEALMKLRAELAGSQESDPQATVSDESKQERDSKTAQKTKALSEVAGRLTEIQQSALEASVRQAECRSRLEYLGFAEGRGLNATYPWLRLPVAVHRGDSWSVGYFLLTGLHSLHVLFGLLKLVAWRRQSAGDGVISIRCVLRYWNLLAATWCLVLVFTYLL